MCDNPTKEPHTLTTQLLGADPVICGGRGESFLLDILIFLMLKKVCFLMFYYYFDDSFSQKVLL